MSIILKREKKLEKRSPNVARVLIDHNVSISSP